MTKGRLGGHVRARRLVLALATVFAAAAVFMPATAFAVAPYDGTTVSAGLGPTFGDPWCANAAAGSSIANQQGTPLALIPYEAIGCTLDKFQNEATAAGLPHRMDYSMIGLSAGGRNMYGVVVNALETPNQIRDFQRWQQLRAIELTDPTAAAILLNSWGPDVKMPLFIEANIHGDEEEGADAIMQAIRDLMTTPYGVNPSVDKILDHAILIVIPNQNPDGRFIGQRANANNFDMNRDFLVQSQSETRNSVKLQQQFLATAGLAMHGYVNPTLIDGLTKPHNPGLEYDIFAYWNQRRVDANQAALAAVGMGITRPVAPAGVTGYTGYCSAASGVTAGNSCGASTQRTIAAAPGGATQVGNTVTITTTAALSIDLAVGARVTISGVANAAYNGTFQISSAPTTTSFTYTHPTQSDLPASGGGTAAPLPSPANAEGWDDWGPFYTQTYMAFYGPDSSTLEMCSSGAGCNGRFGSKRAQYIGFYSSADFWLDNRSAMMKDQIEMFRRGVADADRPQCCFDPLLIARGFTEDQHNWMVPYPKAFVIPFNGDGQRSDAEANRMAQWLLDNGILVQRMTSAFTYGSTTYPAGSYVVYMNQALRGLAYTTLAAGQDVSARITQLYAPPGAWSHGLMWGADVAEIPRGDAAFSPATAPVAAPNPLTGGIRDGAAAPSDFYSVTARGPIEIRAILSLLRGGTTGEIAEASFASTTGGTMPAGSFIFPNDPATKAAIDAAGAAAGIHFERNVGVVKPATTQMKEAPKVAILVNSANPANSDTSQSLKALFGPDAIFVSVLTGANSIQLAPTDPLLGIDVIYNTGQAYPAAANTTARARLNAFFARGGGYLGTAVSATNFTFLTGAVPALVTSPFTLTSSGAGGGITTWDNVGGANSPITSGFGATDYLFMPSNVTYFTATPAGAVIDGRNNANMTGTAPNGPSPGLVAGLWRNRAASANSAAVVVHGNTTANSRYVGYSANPFSRQDAEREWTLIGQAALWSNLTDEAASTVDFPASGGAYSNAGFNAGCSTAGGDFCGTASNGSGPALAKVQVAVQQASSGSWWDGTAFASATPVYADATGTATWSFAFAAGQFPADGNYTVRAKAIDVGGNEELTPSSSTFTIDNVNPTSTIGFPVNGAFYNAGPWAAGCGTPAGDICGAAADDRSGPASVRWSMRRNSTGMYWNGSSFASASQVFITADGAASWSDDFAFSNFPGDGGYTLSARATDRAGNEEATSTATFTVDTTAPASNAVLSGTVNLGWWRNPTVTITATDPGGAGIQKIEYRLDGGAFVTYSGPFVVTGDGARLLEYRATDNLGNVEALKSLSFNVDGNAPTTTAALSPPPTGGFYRAPTTVTLTANDGAGSGAIAIQYQLDGSGTRTYTGPFQVPTSGSHTLTYRAVDLTNLVETTKTLSFTNDGYAPSSKATLSPSTITGFYSSPTTVTLSATDNAGGSGVASIEYLLDSGSWTTYSGPFAVSGNGSHTVQFHATDNAGNVEAMKTKSFTIDGAGPNISIASPMSGGTYTLGSSVTPDYSCTDIASGVASCTGPATVDTSTVGPHSYTVNAADNAGNTSSLTATYNVAWPFSWSSPPSKGDAGKDLAIKFKLGGANRGLDVLAAGSPTSGQVNCSNGAAIGSQSATTGSLSYSGGTYTYNWKTQSSWKNTCRKFALTLDDGSVNTLTIQFK